MHYFMHGILINEMFLGNTFLFHAYKCYFRAGNFHATILSCIRFYVLNVSVPLFRCTLYVCVLYCIILYISAVNEHTIHTILLNFSHWSVLQEVVMH